jgi:uncharacterized damage-inducible protein DinB
MSYATANLPADTVREMRRLKAVAEAAVAQIADDQYNAPLGTEDNSVAVLMKHVGGNLRSRWTDFLDSDGEKPDRHRDQEFIIGEDEDRAAIERIWDTGWQALFDTLGSLEPADMTRTVAIRGQPHEVPEAIFRSMTHVAYHVGQIVMLAKHYAGDRWQTLSIARGKSEEYRLNPGPRFPDTESEATAREESGT